MAYTVYLVVDATDHPLLPTFRIAMLVFVVPLTVITLVVAGVRTRRNDPDQESTGRAR